MIKSNGWLLYLDLVVEIAQFFAQFGVSRFALVMEATLAILTGIFAGFTTATTTCAEFAR